MNKPHAESGTWSCLGLCLRILRRGRPPCMSSSTSAHGHRQQLHSHETANCIIQFCGIVIVTTLCPLGGKTDPYPGEQYLPAP
eukprot:3021400-Amphidinium_carterae.1